jgi:pimeloyl-ACP methyl ester carboxylesterase
VTTITQLPGTHHLRAVKACGNLLRAATCLALLLSSALRVESQAPNTSVPAPLGILTDLGGYRVHLYCIGQGNPTVMIVGAAFSFDWGLVQPEVAKFTRVCTFDPSGTAWSDPFRVTTNTISSKSTPRKDSFPTCDDRVDEIHRLITMTPIKGPYILVGFSVGALWARLYTARYPDNIVGMVVVDHAFEPIDNAVPVHSSNPGSSDSGYSPPLLLSKPPIAIGFEDNSNFTRLPERDQELHSWALSRHPSRVDHEMFVDCLSRIKNMTRGQAYPLGNIDLAVISTANEAPAYVQLQANILALSRNSKHIIAWNSTHMVPIDEPAVVVGTIHELVERVRRP